MKLNERILICFRLPRECKRSDLCSATEWVHQTVSKAIDMDLIVANFIPPGIAFDTIHSEDTLLRHRLKRIPRDPPFPGPSVIILLLR